MTSKLYRFGLGLGAGIALDQALDFIMAGDVIRAGVMASTVILYVLALLGSNAD